MQDAKYLAFLKWKSKLLTKDDPQTVVEWCNKYECTPEDIKSFILKPEFEQDLLDHTLKWAKSKIPELIHTLFTEVKKNRSVADGERFINMLNKIDNKEEGGGNTFNFFQGLNHTQYAKIIQRESKLITQGNQGLLGSGSEE